MKITKLMKWSLTAAVAAFALPAAVNAADYPNRPINVVVPWGTGGGSDQLARNWVEAAKEVAPDMIFNVTNMPGANGLTGLFNVMAQPADGYTIYQIVTANYILDNAEGRNKYGLNDIEPIAGAGGAKDMFYISADDDRFKSWDDIAAFAKKNPGKLKMSVSSLNGFTKASAGGALSQMGLDITLVPYPKPAERFGALLGHHADILFQRSSDVSNFIEAGKFKPVLVFNETRLPDFPDIPTTVEKGAPNSTLTILRGLAVKAGTPAPILAKLQDVFGRAAKTEKFMDYLEKQASKDVLVGPEFGKVIATQWKQMGGKP